MYGSSPAPYDQISWPLEPTPNTGTIECQFTGRVDEAVSDLLIQEIEDRTQSMKLQNITRKRIMRVGVEMLQNLHHHAIPKKMAGFRVVSSSTGWWIASRNEVSNEVREAVENRIAELKALELDELRSLQMNVLNSHDRSAHGGGGVGLIEILRRTQKQLDLRVLPSTEGNWILELTAHIAQEP
jgi:hypothetical protein